MRIVLTGAAGGIGRSLMSVLRRGHEVTGIVRTPRPTAGGPRFVAFADKSALAEALTDAGCVIHCALDARAKGHDFLRVNRAMNTEILTRALAGSCQLYVFVSSQVVYSGTDPVDAAGYREDQALVLTQREDDYTRLKIESEREVIEACTKAGIGYLIVRPTVVMGPGMAWSEGVVKASRRMAVGVGGRTMNLVEVDDLSRQLAALIDKGIRNDIFNIGTINTSSEDYFRQVGALTDHRPLFVPDWLMRGVARFSPSTLWFFARDVAINNDKLIAATGFRPDRPLAGYFARKPNHGAPNSLEALRERLQSPEPFRTHGRGYHLWFNTPHADDRLAMSGYSGIVELKDNRLRVKAGTRLNEICDYLATRRLELATLPEFLGISAGACFFVDVHGSSRAYFSVYDLIEEIRYLDETGKEIVSARDEALWSELRARDSRFILTELTFRCEQATWLSNRMEWESEEGLDTYLEGAFHADFATTIQWYPHYHRLLVYHVNRADGPVPGTAPSVAPFRGLPYWFQRVFLAARLRGRKLQVDRGFRILAPWRNLPFEGLLEWIYHRKRATWRDLEMCLTLDDGRVFIAELRRLLERGDVSVRKRASVGIRFSHDRASGRDYAWVEFVSDVPELVERVVVMARMLAQDGVRFHRGKYVPR
ncbi:MAG: NAD-dependent epimerase/dehydratase family protein [Devosia sp.]